MKIKPAMHDIISTDSINTDFDIPLAYVNQDEDNYNINLKGFAEEEKKIVYPYQEFDNLDVILLNNKNQIIDNNKVLRRSDIGKYYFLPKDSISFIPQTFSYQIIGKKNITYSADKLFNIQIGTNNIDIAKDILRISYNNKEGNIYPDNIYFNSKEMNPDSYLNNIESKDISFITSKDCRFYNGDDLIEIDIDKFFENNTNLWIIGETYGDQNFNENIDTYTCIDNNLFQKNNLTYNAKTLSQSNILNIVVSTILKNYDYSIIKLNEEDTSPILLINVSNKGFIILSNTSFFDNIIDNIDIFYNSIMYVFCNSYLKSNPISTWITDKNPDYIYENNQLIFKNKLENDIDTNKIFGLDNNNIQICNISTSADNILIDDLSNTKVIFKKSTDPKYSYLTDPVLNNDNMIMIYSNRGDIICYDESIYTIKNNIKDLTSYTIQNENIIISIKPFIDSINGINIIDQSVINLPLFYIQNYKKIQITNITYVLYCKDNLISYIEKEQYIPTLGTYLFEIEIIKDTSKQEIYDMRIRGGGDKLNNNYDLLDIGNINGRPYRKGGTFIVTLPTKYAQYKQYIEEAINKHKVSEDYAIILFEDEGDEK